LNIVMDAIIYQMQAYGGISRLYNEILPRMCDMDNSLHVTLLTDGKCLQPLPKHRNIHRKFIIPPVHFLLRPGRLWNRILPQARSLMWKAWQGNGQGQIWHSTYYTYHTSWKGKQVITVHDMIHEHFPNLLCRNIDIQFRKEKRHAIQNADAIICVSQTTCRDIQHFYNVNPEHVYVIYHGYNPIFVKKPLDMLHQAMPLQKPFLLYVGERGYYKNFDHLIQVYQRWAGRKDINLIVIGKAWSVDEKCRLAKLKIQDEVHLLNNVDDEGLCYLYNQAIAFVYPSLYEGFGIPLLEAIACGCPVIASRIPSSVEIADDCPIYFELNQDDSLLVAFDTALNEGRNSHRVRMGLEHVKRYSWHKTARQTRNVYDML